MITGNLNGSPGSEDDGEETAPAVPASYRWVSSVVCAHSQRLYNRDAAFEETQLALPSGAIRASLPLP